MNYMKIQNKIMVLMYLKFIGTIQQKNINLDKVEGISIREHENLKI